MPQITREGFRRHRPRAPISHPAPRNEVGGRDAIPSSASQSDMDLFADTPKLYCVLSRKSVKPACREVTLMLRNMQDPNSAETQELLLANRIHDMVAYFANLGLPDIFESSVMSSADKFASEYTGVTRSCDRRVQKLSDKLREKKEPKTNTGFAMCSF